MSDKILIVDDETFIREEVVECLSDGGHECVEAANGSEALALLHDDPNICLVLVDLRMPGISGLEMIARARQDKCLTQDLEYIVITGHGETSETIDALKKGVVDFLLKPVDFMQLIHAVDRAQELLNQKRAQRHYNKLQSGSVAKTIKLEALCQKIDVAYAHVMNCLASDTDYQNKDIRQQQYKDPEKGRQVHRIGEYAAFMAKQLGWSAAHQKKIQLAAPLHDIGKIGTPKNILLKTGDLADDEWRLLKQHPVIGYRVLSQSQQPVMQMAADIALGHHERWNGSGYPLGLAGSALSMEACITSLVVVYDTLRSERPYKPALSHQQAIAALLHGDDKTQPCDFNPKLLALFKTHTEQFNRIYCHP